MAGKVVSISVVVEDVTERKRIEEALRERAEELQAVLDAVPAAVFVALDPACRMMTGNRTCHDLLRLPRGANPSKSAGEDAPRSFRALKDGMEIAPEDLPVQKAAATGTDIRGFELELAFDDGDAMHIYGNAAPLFDASGKPRGAVGAFVDVSAIVAAREASVRRYEELERLVAERTADRDRLWQISADLTLVLRLDRIIKGVNPAWTSMLGWAEQELVGSHIANFIHPDDRDMCAQNARLLAEGVALPRIHNRFLHKDGSYRSITWTTVVANGLIHGVGRDVTAENEKTASLELVHGPYALNLRDDLPLPGPDDAGRHSARSKSDIAGGDRGAAGGRGRQAVLGNALVHRHAWYAGTGCRRRPAGCRGADTAAGNRCEPADRPACLRFRHAPSGQRGR